MREIKFRLLKTDNTFTYFFLEAGGLKWTREFILALADQPDTIQFKAINQYTGLKDKKGQEIYEGDIVRVYTYDAEDEPGASDYTLHQIKYMVADSDYPAFDLSPSLDVEANGLSWALLSNDYEGVEVVGNIYENQELLDGR